MVKSSLNAEAACLPAGSVCQFATTTHTQQSSIHHAQNTQAADRSCSCLSLHEEIGSKHSILIWRVFRHLLTGFPLLNNLVVLEAKDVDQSYPRTTGCEPNSSVNCHQVSVFQSAHRFKFLLGKCGRIFLHPS